MLEALFARSVHCECAPRVFVACVRMLAVILTAEEREAERRRDGGHANETEGEGERGTERVCS